MKITQLFKIYWPDNGGGIAKVMESIAEGFSDCVQEIIVCQDSRRKKSISDRYQGVPVRRCRQLFALLSTPVSLQFLYDIRKRTKDSDIVIYHFPYPMVDLAVLLRLYSGRLVVWWHCGFEKYEKLAPLYRPFVLHTLKKADCILVSSKGNMENSEVLRHFRKKCRVIPFCVSDECFIRGRTYAAGQMQNFAAQISLQQPDRPSYISGQTASAPADGNRKRNGRIRILFIGRLVWYKGCDILLKAFAVLRRKDCELVLVGSGPLEQELKDLAASFHLKHVVFTGMVSEEEKMRQIAACDFLVLPSISKAEAFAVVQLEAMAFGKPVINTALKSGVPYVSVDGVTGKTVKPGSIRELAAAMEELAGNAQLRKTYGENALRLVEKEYTQELMVQRHRKVFEKLLQSR